MVEGILWTSYLASHMSKAKILASEMAVNSVTPQYHLANTPLVRKVTD